VRRLSETASEIYGLGVEKRMLIIRESDLSSFNVTITNGWG